MRIASQLEGALVSYTEWDNQKALIINPNNISDSVSQNLLAFLGYCLVAVLILLGWLNADLDLIRAQEGLGYWLGIIGSVAMLLLLFYPARKRAKVMRNAGPVRYWFKLHMILGIVGPVLIIFHSNFELGSLNSRVALFCMIIVASSGIVGRYIYSKLHYGLYGRRASLVNLRADLSELRGSGTGIAKLVPSINTELNHWEDSILQQEQNFLSAFWVAATIAVSSRVKYRQLKAKAMAVLESASSESLVVGEHQARLQQNMKNYLHTRTLLLRKFAQYRAFESLFSLWHIVHYPLFLLLVLAAIVHVVAVHMY